MPENIKLAEFDIDIDAVVRSAAELKKVLDQLKKAQKENTLETDEQNEAYVQTEADIKALNKEYQQHIKAIQANTEATVDASNRQKLMNITLQEEATSIAQAREQNKLLNKLRNETNISTAEGQAELKLLNDALDKNNKFIKENVDELSKQKMNVGNYTESILQAADGITIFGVNLGSVRKKVSDTAGVLKDMASNVSDNIKQFNGLSSAQKAQTIATNAGSAALKLFKIALAATGIGLLIVALGSLVTYFTKTQRGADLLSKVFKGLGAAVDIIIDRISQFGEAIIKFTSGDFAGGFDDMKKSFAGIGDEIKREVGQAVELEDAYQRLRDKEIALIGVQAERKKKMEELRLAAKDESKSLKERADLLQQAGDIEKQGLDDRLAIAKEDARISQARLDMGESTREQIEENANVQAKVLELQTESLKQQRSIEAEKQGLIKRGNAEALSQQKEITDKAIQNQKDLLDLYIAEQGERARTLSEQLQLEQETSDKKKAILDAELKAKKISQANYDRQIIEMNQDLARRQAEISVENAMREIDANKMALDKQRENAQFLSDDLAKKRKAENDTILKQEQELAALKLQNGLINQQEYDDAIRELSETNRIANKQIDDQRREIEKQEAVESRAIAFQEELAQLEQEGATKFELQQAQLAEQRQIELDNLKEQHEKGLLSDELYNRQINAITRQYTRTRTKNEIANEKALAEQRLDIANSLFGALADVIDKNSAFGKALAVSQALINTFQGITSALAAPFPLSIAAVAAAGLTGFAAVKKIVSTKVPKVKGGNISGGDSGAVSSMGNEMKGLAGNQSNLTAVAASGNATVQQQIDDRANASGLSESVATAVREGASEGTARGSERGLTNLSNNRSIQRSSTF